ncbi:glycine cleavage system aminomethyltransferase GcvT [Corynebacterium hindlerae]|uniref:glycine cleavage system aminomethyltransferase GcvT n=1 Tax=Corynebacterium hindlerae TaxID=699041 RepID=UPI001AD640EE|nr:glycine cleavage system aminomethyltransferase GcvT [Corynebacterium hindlerae]QTH59127.1 glycine cleavage system aminomethyltransferase GcvT [Corynebacterium hindlerae]
MLSPLHAEHEKLGALFTDFGGWEMPLRYGNELDEHRAVRTNVGLFDLSHMGEVRVTGAEAGRFLDYALISQLSAIAVGKAKYTMIVNEQGHIIDDLIVYRLGEAEFMVVPNAGNAATVAAELVERAKDFDVTVEDESADIALIAVQGPRAAEMLGDIPELKYYSSAPASILGHDVLLARTGYTGEDGFELFLPASEAPALWQALIDAGSSFNLLPCGLACRDSLRLEAGMPLYGHELTLDLQPADAGLGVLVSKKKTEDFVGSDVLIADYAPARKLVGLQGEGRRAARAGSVVLSPAGEEIGVVTSGQLSPTLGYPIAMAYVAVEHATEGNTLDVDIRGKKHTYTVVTLPFYSRPKD